MTNHCLRRDMATDSQISMVKMFKSFAIFIFLFSISHCMVEELAPIPDCENNASTGIVFQLSVNSRLNQIGDWEDTVTNQTEPSNSSDSIRLDVTHRTTECGGRHIIYIQVNANIPKYTDRFDQVIIAEPKIWNSTPVNAVHGRFSFHPRCGTNIIFINEGQTAKKIDLEDPCNSAAFTNRPMNNNEIFEVRLGKKSTKFNHSLGIGIITCSPTDIDILPEMWKSPVAWMYHIGNIYSNKVHVIINYGRNINKLKVGDRVGVMRSEFGNLHFFINGVDQGPAILNVPSPVYGVLELWYNAAEATIVDTTSPT